VRYITHFVLTVDANWHTFHAIAVHRRTYTYPPKGVGIFHSHCRCVTGTNIYMKSDVYCLVIMNVNATKNVPQKCQKCPICGHQICSFKLQIHQTSFSAGALSWTQLGELKLRVTTLPKPSSRLGRGTSLPYFSLSTHSASRSQSTAPRLSGPST